MTTQHKFIIFVKGFFIGFFSFFKSFKFIYQNNLLIYWIPPLILSAGLMALGVYLNLLWENEIYEPLHGNFLEKALQWIDQNLKKITVDFLLVFNSYITLILMSPVFTRLSARTEFIINKKKYISGLLQLLKDIRRAIIIAIKNGLSHLVLILIYYLIGNFYPEINRFKYEILIILGFYFYGYSFIDYILERKKMDVKSSIKFVRSHAGLSFSIGLCFSLLFFIPIIGPTFGGVSATIASVLALNQLKVLGKL